MDCVWSVLGYPSKKDLVDPSDKYILITGCDTGLGYQTAKNLDKLGFQVIAACLFPEGEGAKNLVKETSDKLKIISLNVTSDESCKAALIEVKNIIKDRSPGLHALINNAGMCVFGDFDWQKMSQVESVINVNFVGVLRVTKYFMDIVVEKTGRIINVTSILGFYCTMKLSVYGATKAALESFSRTLELELFERGISVCSVAPGLMTGATGLMRNSEKSIQDMWDAMSEDKKQKNKSRYESLIKNSKKANSSSTDADNILGRSLDSIISCVSMTNPPSILVPCQPTLRLSLMLVRYLPTNWGVSLIKMMRGKSD